MTPAPSGANAIHEAVVNQFRRLALPAGAAILDAPCGDGAVCERIAAMGSFLVVGADVDPAPGDRPSSATGGCRCRYAVANLDSPLPWRDSSFDLVVCVEGIEHLEDAFAFCREVHRIVRPGGCLLVTTPNILSIRSRIRYFGSGFYTQDPRPLDESSRHPLHHVGLRTFWEWRYLLHTCGFALVHATHTHIKPISAVYAVWGPFIRAYTRIAMRKEKNAAQRGRNREIVRSLLSPSLLLGENLLLVSRRDG